MKLREISPEGNEAPRHRVLVVDDEDAVRRLIAEGLTELGFRVTTASEGSEAISLLQGVAFDGLVIDLQMAPVGGWEVIEYMRDAELNVACILLSAHIDVDGTVTALRAGVFDVMQKPVRLVELSSRLRDAIHASKAALSTSQGARSSGARPQTTRGSESRLRLVSQARAPGSERLIGTSEAIANLRKQVRRMRRFHDVPVLIYGPPGSGKTLVAQAIHEVTCPSGPRIHLGCAVIPRSQFSRELLGYQAGAFPGATVPRAGQLELASGGTLVLEDVDQLSAENQAEVFRVLDSASFRRMGSDQPHPTDLRLICTTHRLPLLESKENFRADLLSRISGVTLYLPDLAERLVDIEVLAIEFLRQFSTRYPGLPTRIHELALSLLLAQSWSGNVAELRAIVEQAAIFSAGSVITRDALEATIGLRHDAHGRDNEPPLGPAIVAGPNADRPDVVYDPRRSIKLNDLQREMTIQAYHSNEANLARTARALGIARSTLRDRLRRYGEI